MHKLLNYLILGVVLFFSLTGKSNSFLNWCDGDDNPTNVKSTIDYLLKYSKADSCKEANKFLENISTLEVVAPSQEFDLKPIADFYNIHELSLNGLISNIDVLEHLTYLKKLNLNFTSLTNLNGLEKQRFLKSLRLDSNYNLESIEPLQHLPSLLDLEIAGADSFTDEHLGTISKLTQLKSMVIADSYEWNSKVFAQQLAKLSNLQSLKLDNVKIESLSDFAEIKSLKSLYVLWNETITNFSALENLPLLRNLHIERSNLANMESLKNLRSLKNLAIRFSYLRNANPIKEMENLEILDLTGNAYLSTLPSLANFKKLKTIIISDTAIKDIDFIRGAENLVEFIAVGCDISDLSPLSDFKYLRVTRL